MKSKTLASAAIVSVILIGGYFAFQALGRQNSPADDLAKATEL